MGNPQKTAQVKKIGDSITKNQNFVLIKYQSINTKTFNDLKVKLKNAGSSLTIIKNTLFEKSVNILGGKDKTLKDIKAKFFPLKDPTAIIYLGENWSKALKAFYDFSKDIKNISFKLGILDKEVYDQNQLLKISQLPGRDQLIANIIGSFKSPTQKLVYSMNYNLNKFVYILKQKSKGGGENHV